MYNVCVSLSYRRVPNHLGQFFVCHSKSTLQFVKEISASFYPLDLAPCPLISVYYFTFLFIYTSLLWWFLNGLFAHIYIIYIYILRNYCGDFFSYLNGISSRILGAIELLSNSKSLKFWPFLRFFAWRTQEFHYFSISPHCLTFHL